MKTSSYWLASSRLSAFPKLQVDLKVDVAIVGGGITGITAAYLLKKAGKTVALLERDRFARVDTGHTTAHLTFVTDLRMTELARHFGKDRARAAWDAGLAAMHQIHENIQDEDIDCGFAWVPGFLHAPFKGTRDERRELKKDAKAATELGFEAAYVDSVPLFGTPGIRFPNQARFHPVKYLSKLLESVSGGGSHVFEHTEATEFEDDPLRVKTIRGSVQCRYLVIATHVPLMGKTNLASATLFQTKLAPYTSYAVGARVRRGEVPDAAYWDTSDPYNYLRIDPGQDHDLVIFGGRDHKTGQVKDTEKRFRELEKTLSGFLPQATTRFRWSGQVVETNDGLPFIGETADRQFVATGYAGNGMTFGTLGAMMARDAALGKKSPWAELFDVGRKKVLGGTWNYLRENIDYPYYMVRDRLRPAEAKSLRAVKRGEGKIVKVNGKRLAAHRDEAGKITIVSPVCTHMGCIVAWNTAEKTWDCPCHGSRFHPTGEVLAGPAEAPLEKQK